MEAEEHMAIDTVKLKIAVKTVGLRAFARMARVNPATVLRAASELPVNESTGFLITMALEAYEKEQPAATTAA